MSPENPHRRTVALFGGSFDPPHVAHVLAVAAVLSLEDVDAVWVLPVARHPLGKAPTSMAERMALCRAAFALFGGQVEVRDDERHTSGRTWDLVAFLRERHPTVDFRLVIGSDQLTIRDQWHRFDDLCRAAPPIVLGRPGHPAEPPLEAHVTLPAMSSTEARAALARGELPGWLPRPVREQIAALGLYGLPPGGAR